MRTLVRVMCIILCVWLLLEHNVTDGKRIFAIVMASWYSRQVIYRSLLMALNKRGHELVVVTSNPMRDLTLKNYTEIELPFANKLCEQFSEETRPLDLSIFESTKLVWRFIHKIDDATFNEPGFMKLYGRDSNEKFDVVIVEAIVGLSLFTMAHRFNAPLIEQKIVKKYLEKDMPNIIDIAKNISILLVNENPAYTYVKPEQPNMMFFSGFHINKTPPLLPKDLRRFLDDATEGFIYVSLGSITSWSILSKETLENFVQVFSKLPYKIVLKSESDEWSSRKLDNVFISKWFPQQGILAHPNIKLYIYQSGLQSTEKAVHYAVPLLGIPIMFDQYARVQRLASLGVAIHLKLNELTRENFDAAIRQILTDKSYKEKMICLSSIAKDQPNDSMGNAIWWIEYTMKHKERMHYLRFSEIDTPWYQRYDMDIIALLATTIFIIASTIPLIILWILRFIFRQFCIP